ncbi:MAG: 3-phosphoshikimate 1-carboxyvinyltransferase [Candidatus Omnitrophica bacterium]|nr:3-phosphoshikimate 1-carboxyvinyltransferase [Candidatus Omnitrophota bacterium]
MNSLTAYPVSRICGEYLPPGDKSISHRLTMLGALAQGTSHFTHFLNADDCLGTMKAFQAMGVRFRLNEQDENERPSLTVDGVGLQGLKPPSYELDLGNSGTTMRLLLGILAGQPFEAHLTGDNSLKKRPMRRVTEPLKKMGARITGRDNGNFAPLTIQGGPLTGISWENQIASAQVKSAVLLAGLYADGETSVLEPVVSRDHTERLLAAFGAPVKRIGARVVVERANQLQAIRIRVPGDLSSAAFFIVAALLVPQSDLLIRGVGLNPTRIGMIDVLKSMGANLEVKVTEEQGGEPLGEIRVRTSRLRGCKVTRDLVPSLIDELPILMIACALADGESVIQGAEELRVKETDRIHSMVTGLYAIGARVKEVSDGCVMEGVRELKGGTVSSFEDHRTAMSFLIAGFRSKEGVRVSGAGCIQTSYPGFTRDLNLLSGGTLPV